VRRCVLFDGRLLPVCRAPRRLIGRYATRAARVLSPGRSQPPAPRRPYRVPIRRASVVLAVVLAACALAVAVRPPDAHPSFVYFACGVERWRVKTLEDRPTLLPAKLVTLHYLVTRPAPASLPDTRLPFERHVFTVYARVTLVRAEEDGDFQRPSPGRGRRGERGIRQRPSRDGWPTSLRPCTRSVATRRSCAKSRRPEEGATPDAEPRRPDTRRSSRRSSF
jgi:hypothetical protein